MHFLLAKCTDSKLTARETSTYKVIFVPTFCESQHFTLRKIQQNQKKQGQNYEFFCSSTLFFTVP